MENIRIQDDLFTYVNQEKLDQLVIPDDAPSVGGFASLRDDVQTLMINEFVSMSESGNYPNDYLARACTLFRAAMNVEKKEADGVAPALKALSVLETLGSVKDMNKMNDQELYNEMLRQYNDWLNKK